jgi:hypothetical protein
MRKRARSTAQRLSRHSVRDQDDIGVDHSSGHAWNAWEQKVDGLLDTYTDLKT